MSRQYKRKMLQTFKHQIMCGTGDGIEYEEIESDSPWWRHVTSAVFTWHKLINDGWESVEDAPHAGWLSKLRTDDKVQRKVLNSDHRLSVRMVADEIGNDKMIVYCITIENLAMSKICCKQVVYGLAKTFCVGYLTINGITTIPQPLYSSELTPVDYFLFPRVKYVLEGFHHHDTLSSVRACTRILENVPESAYQASSCGKAAGKSVSTLKGCTLKIIDVL